MSGDEVSIDNHEKLGSNLQKQKPGSERSKFKRGKTQPSLELLVFLLFKAYNTTV